MKVLAVRSIRRLTGVVLVAALLAMEILWLPAPGAGAREPKVKLGIEVLLQERLDLVRGRRVGLLTNHTGVDSRLRSSIDLLYQNPEVNLVALFSPEHGIRGAKPDGQQVDSYIDPFTHLPVYSLYGRTRTPKAQWLQGLDVIVVDIQDIGSYWYTYQYTMSSMIEAAGKSGLPVVVLDRPNPLGGNVIEGPIMASHSIWRHPLPLRPGLTIGELALFFNDVYLNGIADVTVVKMKGWKPSMYWSDTGLQWVNTSPNIPTADTALVYAGNVLFERSNVTEARGTTKPFQFLGAPWIVAEDLARTLNAQEIPGVLFRPVYFVPNIRKYQGQEVGGVETYIVDKAAYRSVKTALYIAKAIHDLYPDHFQWQDQGLPGASRLMNGTTVDQIWPEYQRDIEAWKRKTQPYRLY